MPLARFASFGAPNTKVGTQIVHCIYQHPATIQISQIASFPRMGNSHHICTLYTTLRCFLKTDEQSSPTREGGWENHKPHQAAGKSPAVAHFSYYGHRGAEKPTSTLVTTPNPGLAPGQRRVGHLQSSVIDAVFIYHAVTVVRGMQRLFTDAHFPPVCAA